MDLNLDVEEEKNFKEAVDLDKKAMWQLPIHSSLSNDQSSKQGQSTKESRQALSKWKSMETVDGCGWNFKVISIQTIP